MMKASSLMSALALTIATGTMAQENRFSGGLELAFPMGDFGDASGIGFGVTLGYEIPVADKVGVMAQLGYINFSGKDVDVMGVTVEGNSMGSIPIQVGLKYYFTDNQEGFYAGLLTGVHMNMVKVPDIEVVNGTVTVGEKTETNTVFGVAPLIGMLVTENVDIALRYQLLFDSYEVVNPVTGASVKESVTNSYLGLRIAYMFGGR